MTHKDYNGWTNYETWCVKLWLDQYGYEISWGPAEIWIEELDELEGVRTVGVFRDLLTTALQEVNWTEIDNSYQEEEDNA